MLVIYSCILAICWFGAKFIVVDKTLQIGELTSLFSYVMGSMMSLMMLSMIFVMITMSVASMRRITEVLREQPDLAEPFAPVELMSNGSIDFDNVHFRYHKTSEEEVLTDINLHIKSGETIGIIGGTGCGKTSLVNLISRLYDVQQGSVKVGGVDVKDYDMKFLRDQVSVVLQKTSCSQALYLIIYAGVTKTPPRKNVSRLVSGLALMNSSSVSPISTIRLSSVAVLTYPAVRNSVYV